MLVLIYSILGPSSLVLLVTVTIKIIESIFIHSLIKFLLVLGDLLSVECVEKS